MRRVSLRCILRYVDIWFLWNIFQSVLNSLNCNLLFPDLVLVFSWFLLENNTSLDILVDGGRRVRRPVTPSMVESEAGRRMSAARTSISDVRISSSGRPSLSELGLGKTTKWYIPACSNLETEKYHKIDRLIRNIVSQNIYLMFWNQWFFLSLMRCSKLCYRKLSEPKLYDF